MTLSYYQWRKLVFNYSNVMYVLWFKPLCINACALAAIRDRTDDQANLIDLSSTHHSISPKASICSIRVWAKYSIDMFVHWYCLLWPSCGHYERPHPIFAQWVGRPATCLWRPRNCYRCEWVTIFCENDVVAIANCINYNLSTTHGPQQGIDLFRYNNNGHHIISSNYIAQ